MGKDIDKPTALEGFNHRDIMNIRFSIYWGKWQKDFENTLQGASKLTISYQYAPVYHKFRVFLGMIIHLEDKGIHSTY